MSEKKECVEYAETDKKTSDGRAIFHKVTGKRGRPQQFIKDGDNYVPCK